MPAKYHSLGLKYSLSVGFIILCSCAIFTLVFYQFLKNQAVTEAKERTRLIMYQVKALGDYVRDSLRPTIYRELMRHNAQDAFIIEAMSTTHVNMEVMRRFNKEVTEFSYRRMSDSPKNPANMADSFHQGLLMYFRNHRDASEWAGIIDTPGGKFQMEARPIVMESGCLLCHGEPAVAPRELLRLYGTANGFGWQVGSVIGVDTVAVPLDVTIARVKSIALDLFIFGSTSLVVLFFALHGTFRYLVSRPLNELSGVFRRIAAGSEPLGKKTFTVRNDEIGLLTGSFNTLAGHLLEAQEKLKRTAEIERQMMETEKLASLGQLSAGVAHEINNPLGGIKLCFNNLLNTPMDEATKQQHIAVINSGFDRIQNIVRQLLDFSKNSPLSLSVHSINQIIENVLTLSEYTLSKRDIRIIKYLAQDIPDLKVDANKIEQVFLNLFINAAQAMGHGGELSITTRCDELFCYISVSDNGPGIPDDIRPKIFDPFFTTKGVGQGTGLGLTVSKAIIEQHDGALTMESSPNGTTFRIALPLK